jgi:hypothetical protein
MPTAASKTCQAGPVSQQGSHRRQSQKQQSSTHYTKRVDWYPRAVPRKHGWVNARSDN